MKKERPTEYTGMPTALGVAIMRLSKDGQTRNPVADVNREYYEVVLNAIRKFDGFDVPSSPVSKENIAHCEP